MRSMGDPNYRYSPWTPERRKAASERAKRHWELRREREKAEREAEKSTVSFRLRQIRFSKSQEMQDIAARWHQMKAEVAEIDTALKQIEELRPVLRKYGITSSPRV
jgi:hypothetical protein